MKRETLWRCNLCGSVVTRHAPGRHWLPSYCGRNGRMARLYRVRYMKRGELRPCELCGKDAKPMCDDPRLVEHLHCAMCGYWSRALWNRIQRAIAKYGAEAYAMGLGQIEGDKKP